MPFIVHHAGGSTAVAVNQKLTGGTWVVLGTFDLAPGQNHRIELADRFPDGSMPVGKIVADAVAIDRADGKGSVATFALNVPRDDNYEVLARWPSDSGTATNAKIYITHADGEAQQVVNQRASIGQWVSLGTYRFTAGGGSKIEFSNHADGVVMADAVKLVPVVMGAQTSRWQGNVAVAGDYQFFAKWPVDATLSGNAQCTLSGGTWRW